ncbi:ferric uptake regulation protein [Moorella thermoacetica]|uniref:Ferric uptake regulation protein n=1 Tax=Neomoorella thermoacetica TaxID=1525 RepID=A0A1J5NDF1_NEOTH|nr:ferric uptake regulation protein [Moorella thermoacetica]
MENKLNAICQKLQQSEYKVTPQRQVILKTFLEHASEHLSAEEVYNIVKGQHPDIGLATVYRTLDLLAELDILTRINFGDGRTRYEMVQHDAHHHHHMICLGCGRVQEFDADLLESLENLLTIKTGFQITDHQLKFYGYCRECAVKSGDKSGSVDI